MNSYPAMGRRRKVAPVYSGRRSIMLTFRDIAIALAGGLLAGSAAFAAEGGLSAGGALNINPPAVQTSAGSTVPGAANGAPGGSAQGSAQLGLDQQLRTTSTQDAKNAQGEAQAAEQTEASTEAKTQAKARSNTQAAIAKKHVTHHAKASTSTQAGSSGAAVGVGTSVQ
jgi:hypothetical protein